MEIKVFFKWCIYKNQRKSQANSFYDNEKLNDSAFCVDQVQHTDWLRSFSNGILFGIPIANSY